MRGNILNLRFSGLGDLGASEVEVEVEGGDEFAGPLELGEPDAFFYLQNT